MGGATMTTDTNPETRNPHAAAVYTQPVTDVPGTTTKVMKCREGIKMTAEYAQHELDFMRSLSKQLDSSDGAWARESLYVIHELKSLLPGSMLIKDDGRRGA